MKTLLAAASMAALAGCASHADSTGPFTGAVLWVIYKDEASLRQAYAMHPDAQAVKSRYDVGGFATWTAPLAEGGFCVIHTAYPGWYDTVTVFGGVMEHEARHCVEGQFHE